MAEVTEKFISQMKKGIIEYIILCTLGKGEFYVSDIIDILKSHNLIIVEGTLYPLLSRLKDEEIITYYWQESPNGPPRKYYKLTETGKENLKQMHKAWEELSNAINQINQK